MTEIPLHYLLAGAYVTTKAKETWPKPLRFHLKNSLAFVYCYYHCWYARGYGGIRGFGTSAAAQRYV